MTVDGKGGGPTRRFVLRSTLASLAFLLLGLPALAVFGGYFPGVHVISGFGRLLIPDLPWLVLGATLALVLATVAVLVGGGKFTAALSGIAFIVLAGALYVGVQYNALATAHGATYDILRQAQEPLPVTRGADERVVFATVESMELHAEIWRPSKPAGTGVLFIHGGGFTHGSPGLRPYLFGKLADAGSVVVDVEYRLAPPPRWHDAPADVLCALGWFQSVASTYGVDPDRIVVLGDSAGGNLALIAAYGPGFEAEVNPLEPSCAVTPRRPAGVIALYPTADLAATWEDVRGLSDEVPFPEVYVGGPPIEYPDRYDAASIERLIRVGLPPTLLYTGTNDDIVRVERVRDLATTLKFAGTDVQLIEVPFADHAFDGPKNGFGSQLEEVLLPAFIARVTG